jgi:protein-S-isoprenylcysteine O-methyltransferase Ste14
MSAWYWYFFLGLAWIFYFAFHSHAADFRVKASIKRKVGSWFRLYRITYNLISVSGLGALYLFQQQLEPVFQFSAIIPGWIFVSLGASIMLLALRGYNLNEFAGVQEEQEKQVLNISGLNKHIRHPLYSGLILLVIGYLFLETSVPRLISVGAILIYLPIGTRSEENKLVEIFGEEYKKYMNRTPMFFPFLK